LIITSRACLPRLAHRINCGRQCSPRAKQADTGVLARPPRRGIAYSGFIDAASGTGKDSFAVGIAHREEDTVVLDLAHEIVPPFNPQNAMKEAAGLLKSYGIHLVRGDKYAAGFVVEAASRCGLTYEYFEKDRSAIYIEALPLFTSGRARLIDNEKLVRQFATLDDGHLSPVETVLTTVAMGMTIFATQLRARLSSRPREAQK
jgi:hypothetical protein